MTTEYNKPADVPTSTILSRVEQLSDAVTKGKEGSHEFTMRVPAECDRDADLVLSELVRRYRELETKLNIIAAHLCLDNIVKELDAIKVGRLVSNIKADAIEEAFKTMVIASPKKTKTRNNQYVEGFIDAGNAFFERLEQYANQLRNEVKR